MIVYKLRSVLERCGCIGVEKEKDKVMEEVL